MFTLAQIETALANHDPEQVTPKATTRQAAVAIVMRENVLPNDLTRPEMLFIKRAEKEGDPWSGHMAFPGGHMEADDPSLQHAAMRETLEEIGLDLTHAHYLGALSHQHAQPRGRVLDMLIAPHAFVIKGDPEFSPNYEVDEVVWTAMDPMVRNEIHDTETKPMAGTPTVFNGYRLERGHFVWGLTYRILQTFFITIDPSWVRPPEIE
ncbi:MAG: CoA pyrophosphatase [Pseudomonadota bacterium]